MKYKIIKTLDLAGMSVFEPVVRLAYWDDPKEQVSKIFYFILIPVMAFMFFVALWNFIAPIHTTKSGEVPTPPVVLEAWEGILKFHNRENKKMEDFKLKGAEREEALAKVKARLLELTPLIEASDKKLAGLRAKQTEMIEGKIAPLKAEYDQKKSAIKAKQKERKEELKILAESLEASDKAGKLAFLERVRENEELKSLEKETLSATKNEINSLRAFVLPEAKVALKENSNLMEEKQFLDKRKDLLGEDNRVVKINMANEELENVKSTFLSSTGSDLLQQAKGLLRKESSIERIEKSSYAKPMTFLDQTIRSLGCVFLGFFIATIIAIPIGILCGLSKVFMAACMPMISLLKPVSPIVWLPIVFIIVGGFVDKPEESPIHPAFLSSAITVALCSLWPTLVNTALGVASIDKDYLNVAKVLKLGFWSRLFKIIIPSALPLMFTGLRISLGVGWMVLIAAELLSSSEGIGKFVWDMFNNGSSETFAQMFVVVFIVGIVGFFLDRIMVILQRSVSFGTNPSTL